MKKSIFAFLWVVSLICFCLTAFLNVRASFIGADMFTHLSVKQSDYQDLMIGTRQHTVGFCLIHGTNKHSSNDDVFSSRQRGWEYKFTARNTAEYYANYQQHLDEDSVTFWDEWGWKFGKGLDNNESYTEKSLFISMPFCVLLIFFSILPAFVLCRKLKSRKYDREGKCQQCGYDLRASQHRCPECGKLF